MANIDVIEDASPVQGISDHDNRTPDPIKISGIGHLTL